MRIGIDHAFHSFLFRPRPPPPVEIEALGRGIQLNPRPGRRGCIKQRRDIDNVRIAFQKQSTGWMAQHGDERIFQRASDSAGHFCFAQIEN